MAIRKMKLDLAEARPALVLIPAYSEYGRQVIPELRLVVNQFVSQGYALDSCAYGYYIYRIKSSSK
jgi:hypothetical protein